MATNFGGVNLSDYNGLERPMYKDINVGALTLSGPAGLQPDVDEIDDNEGSGTNIYTYAVAVDQAVSGSFELQHDYSEGTDLTFHVHWCGNDAPDGGTDNVKWQLEYSIVPLSGTIPPVTTLTKETAITAQYTHYRTDFAAIDGTSLLINQQILFTLTRIDASADEYGGDAMLMTIGIHYQVDTLGSRTVAAK